MPESTSHGFPYVEPPRHDELPAGVPEQARAGDQRRSDGTLEQGASTIPALGGKAHKGKTYLSHRVDSPNLDPKSLKRARNLRNALSRELAASVGGGVCGVAASLFLKFASQKTAAAEEAFQRGDYDMHRKLSESARMDVLYAREHAAKEGAARPKAPVDPLAAWMKPKPPLPPKGSE
jgi:hypothetical protein